MNLFCSIVFFCFLFVTLSQTKAEEKKATKEAKTPERLRKQTSDYYNYYCPVSDDVHALTSRGRLACRVCSIDYCPVPDDIERECTKILDILVFEAVIQCSGKYPDPQLCCNALVNLDKLVYNLEELCQSFQYYGEGAAQAAEPETTTIIICEGGMETFTCDTGTISITFASYGRSTGEETCPHPFIQTTDCDATNSMTIVSSTCDEQTTCTLSASNSVFGDPCPNTYKYLEVSYQCIV